MFRKIGQGLKALGKLLVAPLSKAKEIRKLAPFLRWLAHAVMVFAVLAVLGYLNYAFDISRLVRAPAPVFRHVWLPLLFLLMYVLAWLAWWMRRLWSVEDEPSRYPDIDQAWDEILAALEQANISLSETPAFLVLGGPSHEDDALFAASHMPWVVRNAPHGPDAPIRAFATRDAVFFTCRGASLLGKQVEILSQSPASDDAEPAAAPEPLPTPAGAAKSESVDLATFLNQALTGAALAKPQTRQQEAVADEFARRKRSVARRPRLLKMNEEVDRLIDRFAHFCGRVVEERAPYCPVNGMLIALPLAATDSEDDANQTAAVCHRELATAREVLRMRFPTVAALCDLQTVPGFDDFLKQIPEGLRRRRLGQAFPLAPDIESSKTETMIEGGVRWVLDAFLPDVVYKLLRWESGDGDTAASAVRANGRLFEMLEELRERRPRLMHILLRGVMRESDRPPLFGGCHFVATGPAEEEQAFALTPFQQLIEYQNFVSWTPEALGMDAIERRRAAAALATFVACIVLFFGIGYWAWLTR